MYPRYFQQILGGEGINCYVTMEQELKKEWLARTGCLIIRYTPPAKAQDAQLAYEGWYLFYYSLSETKFLRRSAIRSLC